MARTAKITNANVAPRQNTAGLVGNTPVRAQDFNDLAGDYVSLSDANAQAISSAVSVAGVGTLTGGLVYGSETIDTDSAACSVTIPVTILNHDGDEGVTLANGTTVGQVKIFLSSTANTVTLTPATLAGASTTIATTTVGEAFTLVWGGSDGWFVVSRSGGANAAHNAVANYPVLA